MVIEITNIICYIFLCVECLNDNRFGLAYEIDLFVTRLDCLSGGVAELVSSYLLCCILLPVPHHCMKHHLLQLINMTMIY